MSHIRRVFDQIVMKILGNPWADRVAGYIAWQRRRVTRRRVEANLRERGLYPDVVQSGPFRGMQLPNPDFFMDSRFEKVFGAYEHELFSLISRLAEHPDAYNVLVNVGAADGFYTVGLGRILSSATVIAYEPNDAKTPVLMEAARLGGIAERISLRAACTPEVLRDLSPSGRVMVVVDVDGYEKPLLDPSVVPWLKSADLLVETHDCFVPGITRMLKDRFSATHQISEIAMKGPDYGEIPVLAGLKMHEVDALVGSERPTLQTWLWMESKVAD